MLLAYTFVKIFYQQSLTETFLKIKMRRWINNSHHSTQFFSNNLVTPPNRDHYYMKIWCPNLRRELKQIKFSQIIYQKKKYICLNNTLRENINILQYQIFYNTRVLARVHKTLHLFLKQQQKTFFYLVGSSHSPSIYSLPENKNVQHHE